MTRHLAQSVIVAAVAVGLALASGTNRRPALVGAAAASVTGVASIFAMGRASLMGGKVVQRALAVMVVAFLVRIVLVGIGTVLVGRAGENVFAFVTAFFVPYFIFAAIEGAYVHALSRGTGPTA